MPWGSLEIHALLDGVDKHMTNFAKIRNSIEFGQHFKNGRTHSMLKAKWESWRKFRDLKRTDGKMNVGLSLDSTITGA